MSLEGQRLGEFEIIERIGQGGMGAVYKAVQTSLQRTVAIKTLQPALAANPEYIARFHREAIAAAGLRHQNLVQVYAAGETGGVHWFAMEFVKGESASVRLKRKGYIEPGEAMAIGVHVANALDYAWSRARLIHRDIKPDNIFLSGDGDVKLGDLGLAKMAEQTHALTVTGASMGTPYYVSPEQAEAKKDIDLRADIYSLGCTLYHLLSGQPPFTGDNPVTIMMRHVTSPVPDILDVFPACPPVLAKVILTMMQKDPAARQQSYEEVNADLRRAFDALNATAVPVVSPRTAAAPQKAAPTKSKGLLYAGLGIGAVVLAAAAFFLVPKLQLGNAPGPGSSASRPPEAGASQTSAFPSQSLGTREKAGDSSATPATATMGAPFVNTLGMKFVPVPILGGPTGGQRVLFSVWDTRVQDYAEFVQETKREWPKPEFEQGPTHPAVNVSWEDAQLFCQWLTGREQAAGRLPAGFSYRLPSDHEWSCAVGIGAREDPAKLPSEKHDKINDTFPWGTEWPPPKGSGNYAGEELQPAPAAGKFSYVKGVIAGYNDGFVNTSPVGSFAANRFGLYDMGGNVRQWCEDWYDKDQKDRVLRGAAWDYGGRYNLLSSHRIRGVPGSRGNLYGFRCVVGASAPEGGATAAPAGALHPPVVAPAPAESIPAAATKDAPFVNSLGMKFVPVPVVSGPAAGQKVLFSVWDTRVEDYAAYAAANPKVDGGWKTQNKDGVPAGRELNHPVVGVSWEDAQGFCQWLTEKEIAEGKLPKGLKYRLPTDEEWSWAVGLPPELGTTPAEKSQKNSVDFPWGKDYPPTRKVGNYADEAFHAKFPLKKIEKENRMDIPWLEGYDDGYATTSPVGSFPANAYGLYDMGGNVWQWCEDWYDASHTDRVLRGASWPNHDRNPLLSSSRNHYVPGSRNFISGFRCVVGASAPSSAAAASSPSPQVSQSSIASATEDAPFVNSLGMKFVPVPIVSGPTAGQRVLFGVWDVRVQDYTAYASARKVDDAWTKAQRDGVPVGRELNHPVVGVSWEDAQAFCQWLTEKDITEGKLPKGLKYRLPTDEEWSWAVGLPPELGTTPAEKRGKNSVDFPWGKDYPPTKKVGNYGDEAFHAKFPKDSTDKTKDQPWIKGYDDGYATTSPVGSFPANAYGLYDMGGNVWQWCEDWFDASHKDRVLRGAAWNYNDRFNLLSSHRNHGVPGNRISNIGFRCVVGASAR